MSVNIISTRKDIFVRTTKKAFEERHAEDLARYENEKVHQDLVRLLKADYLIDGRWEHWFETGLNARRAVDPDFEVTEGLEKYAPWMPEAHNPALLRQKPLSELGTPYAKREDYVLVTREYDYREHRWPRSAGPAVRHVTPEEHHEILWRFTNTMGLTLPDSEVPNVGFTLAEILATPFKQPGWIIEGLLREGGAAMVFGPSGVGKTWFVSSLALLAAHGKGIAACEVLRAGPGGGVKTLVVDGEMLQVDQKQRSLMLMEGMEGYEKEALGRINYYHKTRQDHRGSFLDLGEPAWLPELVRTVEAGEYKLVILDNLSTLSPSLEDENSAAAWAPLNETVVALKHLGVAVLLVHHTGKGATKGASYRGSSNLTTTLETSISLERVGEDMEDQGGNARFKVVLEKFRNHGMPEIHQKVLKLDTFGWVVEVDEFALTETLVRRAKSLRYVTQEELGKTMGLQQYQVSRVLKKAIAQGLCTRGEFDTWLRNAKDIRENPDEPEAFLDI